MPAAPPPGLPDAMPLLEAWAVRDRVLTVHTDLKQAIADAERARLQIGRASAEAVPDVTVAAGYTRSFVEEDRGAIVRLQAPIPLWDRKQGLIYEAQANYARTIAFQNSTANRLTQETAAAFARYDAARQQVARLTREVLPRLQDSLDLLIKGYQAGAAQVTFTDVFQAQQELNTARVTLIDARRNLWLAIADLQGLMQIDVCEEATIAQRPIIPARPVACHAR
jgi:cobalt-zinc-cadmium efflux system outer membrane protein